MTEVEDKLAKHFSNETIESKWTDVLLSWINNCVNPCLDAKELNLQCLLDVIKQYDKRMCTKANINAFSIDDVEAILRKRYPTLQIRNLTRVYDSKYQFKKLYIAITVFLFEVCMNETSRETATEICRRLQKHELQMILKVCQCLKAVVMTELNIETSIKAAFIDTYGSAIIKKLEGKTEPKKEPDEEIAGVDPSCTKCKTDAEKTSRELKTLLTPREAKESELRIRSPIQSDSCPSSGLLQMDVNVDDLCMSVYSSKTTMGTRCIVKKRCRTSSPSSSEDATKDSAYSVNDAGGVRWTLYCALGSMVLLAVIIVILCSLTLLDREEKKSDVELLQESYTNTVKLKRLVRQGLPVVKLQWQCKNNFCLKSTRSINSTMYKSLSRCILLCMGPQIWPHPIGYTQYSKEIMALSTMNLEYKFQSVPSEVVHNYLAGAIKLFLKNLFKLEKDRNKPYNLTDSIDLPIKRISIEIDVENDPDPRLRLDTDESYTIQVNTIGNRVLFKVSGYSFCGVRHGLETTSQLILLDQVTGYLITLSNLTIKDRPCYKYRGLMLDTGRNYIGVSDIMRTLDGMASCKLNTFHWRISSETSFPLYLTKLPYLTDYGAYDRSMIYTKFDVKSIVKKAALRGIRVLMEIAAPGPVGRPWSWFPQSTCPLKTNNYTCQNILCTRLLMDKAVFDTLQILYSEILEMTGVNDIFHLSDGMFSITNCYELISDRDGFLNNALERLRLANKGNLPQLPIIWYTTHLMKDSEAKIWERMGVQVTDWEPNPGEHYLGKFRLIHSTNWDLSCKMVKQRCVKYRSWQEMYSWKLWRNVESFSTEGGEAMLWTDLVNEVRDGPRPRSDTSPTHPEEEPPMGSKLVGADTGLDTRNIDSLLWPRATAVAERLWSDTIANSTANKYVYMRLDRQRWRMLLRGIRAQPIWPAWCSFNPSTCLAKIQK